MPTNRLRPAQPSRAQLRLIVQHYVATTFVEVCTDTYRLRQRRDRRGFSHGSSKNLSVIFTRNDVAIGASLMLVDEPPGDEAPGRRR